MLTIIAFIGFYYLLGVWMHAVYFFTTKHYDQRSFRSCLTYSIFWLPFGWRECGRAKIEHE